MYCVISWDISATEPRWSAVNKQMQDCIKDYLSVRPVNTFYLVRIRSSRDIASIQECFNTVKENTRESITYVLSPALGGHKWSGTIPGWESVNAITEPSP
jgi:hypothetical protein